MTTTPVTSIEEPRRFGDQVVRKITLRLVPFLFLLYIIAYLIFRFATEYIRPELKLWLDLTIYQWASLLFAPLFAFLWFYDRQATELSPPGLIPVRTTAISKPAVCERTNKLNRDGCAPVAD